MWRMTATMRSARSCGAVSLVDICSELNQRSNALTYSIRFFGGSIFDCIGSERCGGGCTGSLLGSTTVSW